LSRDAIEYMLRHAPEAVCERGVPFSRAEAGKICQRPFGGMTIERNVMLSLRLVIPV